MVRNCTPKEWESANNMLVRSFSGHFEIMFALKRVQITRNLIQRLCAIKLHHLNLDDVSILA